MVRVMQIDNPWDVHDYDFPVEESEEHKLLFMLNYAVLAPSGHNTQPWKFKVEGDKVLVFADRARALAVIDPDDRELVMSCGAATFHLWVAARRFGYNATVSLLPDPQDADLIAVVSLGGRQEPTLNENKLFEAIFHRRTNRLPFKPQDIPISDLESLASAVEAEGAMLDVITGSEKRKLAELIAEGDRIQGGDKRFRRELAAWIHPSRSQSRDGIPGYSAGVRDITSYAGPFMVRTFDWGEGRAARDLELADGSPALLVISTAGDDQMNWLKAGMALDHLLLLAHDYRLSASYLNQPIEVEHLRQSVGELITQGRVPQCILRMGYGRDLKRTPRRPVSEVLIP
ncbi:MAG: nitroreductase [Rhodothermales bacterium]|nr:nitroreductase [Rhodothermales bacterium]